jgi:hypothetical protein
MLLQPDNNAIRVKKTTGKGRSRTGGKVTDPVEDEGTIALNWY